MLFRTPSKGLFLFVYVDDTKLAGKKQICKVSSIHLHDTRNVQHQVINEGSQDGFYRPSSPVHHSEGCRPTVNPFSTMMSLHTNHFVKKRGMGKKLILTVRTVMLQEHVDMVAGDFNGAA